MSVETYDRAEIDTKLAELHDTQVAVADALEAVVKRLSDLEKTAHRETRPHNCGEHAHATHR